MLRVLREGHQARSVSIAVLSLSLMPDQRRAAKTLEKAQRGRLPAPGDYGRTAGLGDGRPCDGCDETITPMEVLFLVSIGDALQWRLHAVCCGAWLKFKPQQ